MKNKTIIIAFISLAFIPLWLWIFVPQLTKLPKDFSYKADINSIDNFYDGSNHQYEGENRSVTKFSYEVVPQASADGQRGNEALIIKNIFDVRTIVGDKIFSVERLYGIDPKTGKHLAGYGDQSREGYLFAPKNLKKGESFTYWHINYDGPAQMTFVGEQNINGLKVYRYEAHYEGVEIDQTKDLVNLPGVGVTLGVELEPYLELWIEPVTGYLVKYKDDTVAYYYDLKTHERLYPWNHFSNSYTLESILNHVEVAKQEKLKYILIKLVVPGIFAFLSIIMVLFFYSKNRVIKIALISFFIFSGLSIMGGWLFLKLNSTSFYSYPVEKVRVGMLSFPSATAILIAKEKGYFLEQGLEIETSSFDSGKTALEAMFIDKNLDIVTVAQTPVVVNSFDREDFGIISGIISSENDAKILVRNDSYISSPADLKDKTIGVTKGTTGQYFLNLLLAKNNLNFEDIKALDIPAADLPEALNSGKVDAIATWEPHIYNAKKALGNSSHLLDSADTFRTDYYLVAFKDWAKKNPEIIKRFLMAIDKANIFISEHPRDAQNIIITNTNFESQFIQLAWTDYQFQLFLDQSVLLSLEQQARWLQFNEIINPVTIPNFLNLIYFDALEEVKPKAVTIIR